MNTARLYTVGDVSRTFIFSDMSHRLHPVKIGIDWRCLTIFRLKNFVDFLHSQEFCLRIKQFGNGGCC